MSQRHIDLLFMTAASNDFGAIGGRHEPVSSGRQCVRPYPVHHSHSFRESDGLSLKTLLRIRPRDWQSIRERVISHPHEAIPSSLALTATSTGSSADRQHSSCATIATTPLHNAIQKNAPSDVVKAIVQAYPQALFMGNEWNRTPLVLACDDCLIKDGIVMALLEEQMKLSEQRRWPTFAESSGDIFITGASQRTKFAAWSSYAFPRENGQIHSGPENERAMTFRSNIGRYVPFGGYTPSPKKNKDGSIQDDGRDAPPRLPLSSSMHRFWRLLLLELRAPWVFGHSSSFFTGSELPREVHAVVSAQCPVPVVGLAAHLHPSQLSEENEAGDLPLHIACRQLSPSYATTYHRKGEDRQKERRGSASCHHQNKRSRCIRELETQEHSPTTIDVIVTAHPEAAAIPAKDGSLPLNMALAAGNTWRQGGIMSLQNAAPYMLGQRDARTGLFSFMIAACAGGGGCDDQIDDDSDKEASEHRDLDRVETVFQLLRALPEVLSGKE
mmetsp:Transcript_31048/g.90833  ORF Transcript_31048/g.90833 Transcript_31048/m.90833 type:complete len:499 (-) Transcript_31048:141-1637(-)